MNSSNKWAMVRVTLAGVVAGVCASLSAQDPGGSQTGAKSNGVESEQKTVSAVVRGGGVQSQVKVFFKELEQKDGVKLTAAGRRRFLCCCWRSGDFCSPKLERLGDFTGGCI